MSGYGVFPQVYLNVPRPSMLDLPILLCYEAVASITSDFLEFVEDINKIWQNHENQVYEQDIPKQERKVLKNDGWYIVSPKVN